MQEVVGKVQGITPDEPMRMAETAGEYAGLPGGRKAVDALERAVPEVLDGMVRDGRIVVYCGRPYWANRGAPRSAPETGAGAPGANRPSRQLVSDLRGCLSGRCRQTVIL